MSVAVPARVGGQQRARDFLLRDGLPTAEAAVYWVLGLLILLAVFVNRWGSFTPDTEPQLYLAPGRVLMQSLFSWKLSPALGQSNFQTGITPVAFVIFLIRSLGASAWVAVRIWRALLLLVAAWGAVRFFHRLAGDRSTPAGRIAAALLYVANPYVIVSGASTPILLPYALFPWMMLAFARSVDEPRSWRWPAAFALTFFLMGGLNAGIVPLFLLLGVPAYLIYARVAFRTPILQLAWPLVKGGALLLLTSAYWIVPALAARGTASTIAVTTERPADVASTSSYAETVRLLGLWPLYGRQGAQPFLPNAVGYITSPWVVLATFAIPVAAAVGALVSRARGRALAALLLAVGAPVMVGLFPPSNPTPLGHALQSAFDRFPAAIGFRTTNKVGALVVLGLVLLVALGAAEAWPWLPRRRLPVRGLALVVVGAALLGAVFPAWTGKLYGTESTDVPGYWHQAARALNAGSGQSRVLFLPGEEFANYRWGKRGPTDLNDSLLSRPSVLRATVPNGSPYAANMLAALDVPLNDGSYIRGTVPLLARYIGARDLLVRNDMTWEAWGGTRPSAVSRILEAEPGLRLVGSYGFPGQFTSAPGTTGEASRLDRELPPLQRYLVSGSRPIVRAEPVAGTVLIDGDNFGLARLLPLGLLPGNPTYRFLGAMEPSDLAGAIEAGARIVLTDTNRRRAWQFRRTGSDYSATLGPAQAFRPTGDLSFGLFGDRSDTQTVAVLSGARSVTATSYGSLFGPVPADQPAFAFDHNPHTAWLGGGLGAVVGQAVTIEFDHPTTVSELTLRPVLGGQRQISEVRIRAGAAVVAAAVPEGEPLVNVPFPTPTTTTSLTVAVTGVRGAGLNPVGFWGIDVPGAQVHVFARLPLSFAHAASGLGEAGEAALADTPLDVVLGRLSGSPATDFDDEEPNLYRVFSIPDSRSMTFTAIAGIAATLSDADIDHLVGIPSDLIATSSSRRRVLDRASATLDGDVDTAWVPVGPPIGQFIDVKFPGAAIDHIDVNQGPLGGTIFGRIASRVRLSINGGPPTSERLGLGTTSIAFTRRRVHEIRLTITRTTGLGAIRLNEIRIGSLRVAPSNEKARLAGCFSGFELDGDPVAVRSSGTLGRLLADLPIPLEPCSQSDAIALAPGMHRLTPVRDWRLDEVHLSSVPAPPSSEDGGAAPSPPVLTVTSTMPTRTTITTDGGDEPYYLVLGQGFDPRWQASMDGTSLGRPILVDGYSTAWMVTSPGHHTFTVTFAPQHSMNLSMGVSLLALAGSVLLILPRRRWR